MAVMQKFVADLPNASLKFIKDCGHIPHVEKPKEFSSILKEFYLQGQNLEGEEGLQTGQSIV